MANRNRIKDYGAAHGLYARVPNGLAHDYELSAMAKAVALEVWSHSPKWQQSMTEIAKRLKTGRRQVANAFDELEVRGWLVREIVKVDGKGRSAAEVWHRNVTNEPLAARQVEALRCGTSTPQVLVTSTPQVLHSSETISETTSEKNQCPTGTGSLEGPQYSPHGEAHISEANPAEEQTPKGSAMKAAEKIPTSTPQVLVTSSPEPPTNDYPDPCADAPPSTAPPRAPVPEMHWGDFEPSQLEDSGDPTDPFSMEFVPLEVR